MGVRNHCFVLPSHPNQHVAFFLRSMKCPHVWQKHICTGLLRGLDGHRMFLFWGKSMSTIIHREIILGVIEKIAKRKRRKQTCFLHKFHRFDL